MFISLDIETTGFDPKKDHVIEIAAVKFNENELFETFSTLVNPEKKISQSVKLLTGITDEELAKAPTLEQIQENLISFIGGSIIIAHNISFDKNFLQSKNIPLPDAGYDSCELARILLPHLPSYSLEILTHLLDIGHENKHRALSDANAAAKLFQLLIKKASEIPLQKRQLIIPILEKSSWPMKPFFQNIFQNPPQKPTKIIAPQSPAPQTATPSKNLEKYLLETITEEQTILIENGPIQDHLETLKNENIILAVDKYSPFWQEESLEKILPPSQYLCLNTFEKYLKKSFFENSEISLILKTILRQDDLQKGTRQELDVFQEEHAHFHNMEFDERHCASCDENRCFFTKTQKQLTKNRGLTLVSHEMLLTKAYLLPQKIVIIDQTDLFAENAAFLLTSVYKLPTLENLVNSEIANSELREKILSKLGMVFGLCGIFLEKFSDPGTSYKKITAENSHRASPEWKNAEQALENLSEIVTDMEKTRGVIEAFQNAWRDSEHIAITIAQGWDFLIKCVPKNIRETVQKNLSNFPAIIYLSKNMTVKNPPSPQKSLFDTENSLEDDFSFMKKMLGLPSETPAKKNSSENAEKIPLYIAENLPESNTPGNFKKTASYIQKILEKTSENAFLLMNSRQSIEAFHEEFLPLSNKLLLLSQDLSGGFGKIAHQYHHATKKTLIIGGMQLFEKIMGLGEKIPKIFMIHRLPFPMPDDPLLLEIQKTCDNAFIEGTIPFTILKLKRLIQNYTEKNGAGKKIYLLDSRISKDYGKRILDSLKNLVETKEKNQ